MQNGEGSIIPSWFNLRSFLLHCTLLNDTWWQPTSGFCCLSVPCWASWKEHCVFQLILPSFISSVLLWQKWSPGSNMINCIWILSHPHSNVSLNYPVHIANRVIGFQTVGERAKAHPLILSFLSLLLHQIFSGYWLPFKIRGRTQYVPTGGVICLSHHQSQFHVKHTIFTLCFVDTFYIYFLYLCWYHS